MFNVGDGEKLFFNFAKRKKSFRYQKERKNCYSKKGKKEMILSTEIWVALRAEIK